MEPEKLKGYMGEAEIANMETLKKPSWEPFDDVFRSIVMGK